MYNSIKCVWRGVEYPTINAMLTAMVGEFRISETTIRALISSTHTDINDADSLETFDRLLAFLSQNDGAHRPIVYQGNQYGSIRELAEFVKAESGASRISQVEALLKRHLLDVDATISDLKENAGKKSEYKNFMVDGVFYKNTTEFFDFLSARFKLSSASICNYWRRSQRRDISSLARLCALKAGKGSVEFNGIEYRSLTRLTEAIALAHCHTLDPVRRALVLSLADVDLALEILSGEMRDCQVFSWNGKTGTAEAIALSMENKFMSGLSNSTIATLIRNKGVEGTEKHLKRSAARRWSRAGLEKSRAAKAAKKVALEQLRLSRRVKVFGWTWSSRTAALAYYVRDRKHSSISCDADLVGTIATHVARQMESGGLADLDNRMRFPPEIEVMLAPSHLPLDIPWEAPTDMREIMFLPELGGAHRAYCAEIHRKRLEKAKAAMEQRVPS